MTKELLEKIKRDLGEMKRIVKTTNDIKERYYYYGQYDGILGMLDLLGIDTEELR